MNWNVNNKKNQVKHEQTRSVISILSVGKPTEVVWISFQAPVAWEVSYAGAGMTDSKWETCTDATFTHRAKPTENYKIGDLGHNYSPL